ncbi:MAG: DUF992 domain-containing protein [Hyphomicrobiaceae bacterium]
MSRRHIGRTRVLGAALTGLLASLAGSGAAQPVGYLEAGLLSCTVAGGAGFVIGSTKSLNCSFQSGQRRESYSGVINKFGLDIGGTTGSQIAWTVFVSKGDLARGGLTGNYGGVTGEATVGVGFGANVLVGGSNRGVVLQPLSLQAQQGLNLAVGIAGLELRAN